MYRDPLNPDQVQKDAIQTLFDPVYDLRDADQDLFDAV
jgi:hypothetical protein